MRTLVKPFPWVWEALKRMGISDNTIVMYSNVMVTIRRDLFECFNGLVSCTCFLPILGKRAKMQRLKINTHCS